MTILRKFSPFLVCAALALVMTACDASPGGHEACMSNEDCRDGANGQCLAFAEDQVIFVTCVYDECSTTAQCPSGHVCGSIAELSPRQTNLACIRATCEPGAECSDGEPCTLRLQTSTGGVFTPRPDDYRYACGDDICGTDAPTSVYRITALQIPTMADVSAGLEVGLNIDFVGDTCEVEDFTGGVDNAFMTLSAGLLELASPLDLQAEIDAALSCTAPSASCEPLELFVVLQRCDVTVFSMQDGEGTLLTPHLPTIVDASGRFRVQFTGLPLRIPIRTPTGVVPLALALGNTLIHGTITEAGVDDLVIGSEVDSEAMLDAFTPVLAELVDGPSVDDVESAAGPSDVRIGETCSAHSVGLRASGQRQERAAER